MKSGIQFDLIDFAKTSNANDHLLFPFLFSFSEQNVFLYTRQWQESSHTSLDGSGHWVLSRHSPEFGSLDTHLGQVFPNIQSTNHLYLNHLGSILKNAGFWAPHCPPKAELGYVKESGDFNALPGWFNSCTLAFGVLREREDRTEYDVSDNLGIVYKLYIPVWSLFYRSPRDLIQILGCN